MTDSQARAVHIPAHVQQAMDKHMQAAIPANLKYYQQSGAYVPPHIQQAMQKHMQAAMPEHLQGYIAPYMQQNVVTQHFGEAHTSQTSSVNPPAHPVNVNMSNHTIPNTFIPDAQQSFTQENLVQTAPQPQNNEYPNKPAEPYGFILNSDTKKTSPIDLFKGKSLPIRIAVISGGVLMLLLLLIGVKGLLASPPKLQPYISVAQDQQVLIHLVKNTLQPTTGQVPIPASYANYLNTSELALPSSQSQLLTYLATNKQKITNKMLVLKIDPSVDSQLTQSVSTGGYPALFQSTMADALSTYLKDIRTAYVSFNGKKGRAILSDEYKQASLLTTQFKQAIATAND